MILNIETSSKVCSVALTDNGMVEYQLEDEREMMHAVSLAPFVEKCMQELERRGAPLDAVAVSLGPGSYTGLRIGLSLAKGVCFGKNVPLIGIDTLKILAVKAMFGRHEFTGEELLAPMMDARRMEVYTAVYDFALNEVMPQQPLILDSESYSDLLKDREVWFMGDGVSKAKEVITSPNAHFIEGLVPKAKDMMALSEMALRKGDFLDLAYSVPNYLKEYRTTNPKNKIF